MCRTRLARRRCSHPTALSHSHARRLLRRPFIPSGQVSVAIFASMPLRLGLYFIGLLEHINSLLYLTPYAEGLEARRPSKIISLCHTASAERRGVAQKSF